MYQLNAYIIVLILVCELLPSVPNGFFNTSSNTVGAVATYFCNDSFVLSNGEIRVCSQNGSWSGQSPTCERGVLNNCCNNVAICLFKLDLMIP